VRSITTSPITESDFSQALANRPSRVATKKIDNRTLIFKIVLAFALTSLANFARAEQWLVVGTAQGQIAEIDIDSIKKSDGNMREVTVRWETSKGLIKGFPSASGIVFRSRVDCSEKKFNTLMQAFTSHGHRKGFRLQRMTEIEIGTLHQEALSTMGYGNNHASNAL
jgi:hypothetical protein